MQGPWVCCVHVIGDYMPNELEKMKLVAAAVAKVVTENKITDAEIVAFFNRQVRRIR
jgi:hypothetical protein